jgi:CubicO group peptidase (beta-lactamase class C family)
MVWLSNRNDLRLRQSILNIFYGISMKRTNQRICQIRAVKNKVVMLFFSLVLLNYTCLQAQANKSDPRIKSIAQLRDTVQRIINESHIAGVSIAVTNKDSIIWSFNSGWADIENRIPISPMTNFRAGSATKSFVALGILQLVSEGNITLEVSLKELIPEIIIDNKWEIENPVRLVHLLEHTAGLDDNHAFDVYNFEPDKEISLRNVIDLNPNARKLRWPPGTRFAYSNVDYLILGYILEKITRAKFEEYLKHLILDPLAMRHATFRSSVESRKLLAKEYRFDGHELVEIPFLDLLMGPAGSLECSAEEMSRYVRLMLNYGSVNGKSLFPKDVIQRREIPFSTLPDFSGLASGYGLADITSVRDNVYSNGHGGDTEGTSTVMEYMHSSNTGFVIMMNTQDRDCRKKLIRTIESYLAADSTGAVSPTVNQNVNNIQSYCGYYSDYAPRMALIGFANELIGGKVVTVKNDTLFLQSYFSKDVPYLQMGEGLFRKRNELKPTLKFINGAHGEKILLGGNTGGYFVKTSYLLHAILLYGVIVMAILLFSTIPYFLTCTFLFFFKKIKIGKVLLLYFLSASFLITCICVIVASPDYEWAHANVITISYFVSSILFVVAGITAIYFVVKGWREYKLKIRIYWSLVTFSTLGLILFFSHWGLIGLRFWNY